MSEIRQIQDDDRARRWRWVLAEIESGRPRPGLAVEGASDELERDRRSARQEGLGQAQRSTDMAAAVGRSGRGNEMDRADVPVSRCLPRLDQNISQASGS
ncbi:MAG: hypothetical protein ABI628_05605 [Chloroflexota bacterium]